MDIININNNKEELLIVRASDDFRKHKSLFYLRLYLELRLPGEQFNFFIWKPFKRNRLRKELISEDKETEYSVEDVINKEDDFEDFIAIQIKE